MYPWLGGTVLLILCMDPGCVQAAAIQWNSQSFYQCRVWPGYRNHMDG